MGRVAARPRKRGGGDEVGVSGAAIVQAVVDFWRLMTSDGESSVDKIMAMLGRRTAKASNALQAV